MIERLNEFIKNQGLTISEFEKVIGASDGLLRRAIKNKTDINSKWVVSIGEKYPNLSLDWLIRSEGNMLRDNNHGIDFNTAISKNKTEKEKAVHDTNTIIDAIELNPKIKVKGKEQNKIPLVPLYAMAGNFPGESEVKECDCESYSVPGLKGADFMICVQGYSMYPTYNSGDIVACRRINNVYDAFFQWNRVYILDTDQGPLMKRIKPGSDKEHITIVSDNPDFEPFELHLSQIYHIALVLGCIKLE